MGARPRRNAQGARSQNTRSVDARRRHNEMVCMTGLIPTRNSATGGLAYIAIAAANRSEVQPRQSGSGRHSI
jgi:hypothetical protein